MEKYIDQMKAFFVDNVYQQKGFSLLEMLLSVGVIGFIALGFVQMTKDFIDEKQSISAAEHINVIHEAAYDFIMDTSTNNFAGIHGALANNTGQEILFADLIAGNYLDAGFNQRNSFGRDVRVIAYRVNGGGTDVLQILTTTSGAPINQAQALQIAQNLGGKGGLWLEIAGDPTGRYNNNAVVGTYGMWTVPENALATTLGSAITAPDTQGQTAHVTAYSFVNFENELGDYLYRTNVPGSTLSNRMAVNIDMSNNNLRGVDDLVIAGTLTVDDVADFRGSARVGGALSVIGDITTNGDVESQNGLVTTGAATPINIDDDFTSDVIRFTGTGGIQRINSSDSQFNTLSTIELSASDIGVDAVDVNNVGSFLAVDVDVDDISITGANARFEVGQVNGGGTLDVTGDIDTQSVGGAAQFTSNGVDINGIAFLPTITFSPGGSFTCDSGC